MLLGLLELIPPTPFSHIVQPTIRSSPIPFGHRQNQILPLEAFSSRRPPSSIPIPHPFCEREKWPKDEGWEGEGWMSSKQACNEAFWSIPSLIPCPPPFHTLSRLPTGQVITIAVVRSFTAGSSPPPAQSSSTAFAPFRPNHRRFLMRPKSCFSSASSPNLFPMLVDPIQIGPHSPTSFHFTFSLAFLLLILIILVSRPPILAFLYYARPSCDDHKTTNLLFDLLFGFLGFGNDWDQRREDATDSELNAAFLLFWIVHAQIQSSLHLFFVIYKFE
jgi:hypothetical protein